MDLETGHPRQVRSQPIGRALWRLGGVALVLGASLLAGGCRQPGAPAQPLIQTTAVPALGTPSGHAQPSDADQPAGNLMPGGAGSQTVPTPEPPPFLAATALVPRLPGRTEATPTAIAESGIAGVVTDTQGQPIVDVAIAVVESDRPVPAMAPFTDAQGQYLWRLGPGTYTLEAYRDGYRPARQTIRVEEGQVAKLDFRLERQ